MNSDWNENITEKLASYLSNELDADEMKQVEVWIDASSQNKAIYENLKRVWADSTELAVPELDMNESWERLSRKIDKKDTPGKVIKLNSWLKVAATVSVLIISTYFIYTSLYLEKSVSIVALENDLEYQLPDQSKIKLGKGSSIHFKKSFGTTNRNLELKGTAYFEVKRDTVNPFSIKTGNTLTRVLGTSFILSQDSLNDRIILSVLTGKVSFSIPETNENILEKGQSAIATDSISLSDDPNLSSWYTRKLQFKGTAASKVLESLTYVYGIQLLDTDRILKSCALTAEIENMPIHEVLELLEFTWNVHFEKSGNGYKITGTGCLE